MRLKLLTFLRMPIWKTFLNSIIKMTACKRTSLSGVDLNRRWDNPHKLHHPTIFQTKAMMRKFQETRDVIVCCDIHGHSRREGLFMYGCPKNWNNRTHLTPHTIPTLFDNQSEFFSLHRCTFRVQVRHQIIHDNGYK